MNLTRLMALGILARSGPSHGHQIRRVADLTDVAEWGGVSVGALYRELRAMERDGLVEATRTEKVGNRPERTVYAITDEGQLELAALREQAIRRRWGPGPIRSAWRCLFAADGMDPESCAERCERGGRCWRSGSRRSAAEREAADRQGLPRRARGGGHAARRS